MPDRLDRPRRTPSIPQFDHLPHLDGSRPASFARVSFANRRASSLASKWSEGARWLDARPAELSPERGRGVRAPTTPPRERSARARQPPDSSTFDPAAARSPGIRSAPRSTTKSAEARSEPNGSASPPMCSERKASAIDQKAIQLESLR